MRGLATFLLPLAAVALCRNGLDCIPEITHPNSTCSRITFSTAPDDPVEVCHGRDAPVPTARQVSESCVSMQFGGSTEFTYCNGSSISVLDLGNGCQQLVIDGIPFPKPLCNGTAAPSVQLVDVGSGCQQFSIGGVLQLKPLCNASALVIKNIGGGCLQFITGDTMQTECNFSAPITVVQQTGTLLPATYVVDGTTYPLSRAGVFQAMQAAYRAGGGTVLVGGGFTTDGVGLPQVDRVTLDFGGNIIRMPSSTTPSYLFNGNWGDPGTGQILSQFNLNTTLVPAGTQCFLVAPPWDASLFVVGQLCAIEGYRTDQPTLYVHISAISNFTNGTVCIHDSLAIETSGAAARISTTPLLFFLFGTTKKFKLRNLVVDFNGHAYAASQVAYLSDCMYCEFDNIEITGGGGPQSSNAWVFQNGFGNRYSRIRSVNMNIGNDVRDISFSYQSNAYITDIASINFGGFGPNIISSHHCIWNGLHVVRAHSRGFRVDQTALSVFSNIIVNNGAAVPGKNAATGIRVAFGSQFNTFHGVTLMNNDDFGLVFDGSQGAGCDSNNTVIGLVAYGNGGTNFMNGGNCVMSEGATDLGFGGCSVGNAVFGRVGCPAWYQNAANKFVPDF